MKNNRLPLLIVFVLVGAAIVWRIADPPEPPMPGPVGDFPAWKSIAKIGDMSSQAVNPEGSKWAGAWNDAPKSGPKQASVRLLDFNAFSGKSCRIPDGYQVDRLSWADDDTVRALCIDDKGEGRVVSIDAASGKVKANVALGVKVERSIAWPATSDNMALVLSEDDKQAKIAVVSLSSKQIVGKQIDFVLPKDASTASGGGVAADGSSVMFEISDPAAKDGRAFYVADTATGVAKKAFDLAAIPGRILETCPSKAGVLMVCAVEKKLEDVVYDPASGKLIERPDGVGDLSQWPGAPKTITLTDYDGASQLDLASGKMKTVVDAKNRRSEAEQQWRDFLRDSRLYKMKNGNYMAVSELSGAVDVREVGPDGSVHRPMISRT